MFDFMESKSMKKKIVEIKKWTWTNLKGEVALTYLYTQ
jgi:hypothetical protein